MQQFLGDHAKHSRCVHVFQVMFAWYWHLHLTVVIFSSLLSSLKSWGSPLLTTKVQQLREDVTQFQNWCSRSLLAALVRSQDAHLLPRSRKTILFILHELYWSGLYAGATRSLVMMQSDCNILAQLQATHTATNCWPLFYGSGPLHRPLIPCWYWCRCESCAAILYWL